MQPYSQVNIHMREPLNLAGYNVFAFSSIFSPKLEVITNLKNLIFLISLR